MNCLTCGAQMRVRRENVPYKSLPGTTLVGIEVWHCEHCGESETAIPAINELERVLVHAVCEKPGRLNAREIRFLRKHLGWSGVDFAKHFGVSPESVSRWENAAQVMSAQADRLLRVCATRLEPISDYGELEALLDQADSDPTSDGIRLRHADGEWSTAA